MGEQEVSINYEKMRSWFEKRKDVISNTLIDYININTISPNESNWFPFVIKYLSELWFNVTYEPFNLDIKNNEQFSPHIDSKVTSDRWNLRAIYKKSDDNYKSILFNCHIDVVPASDSFKHAFDWYVKDNCVYWRWACDTKNNLIMLWEAIRFLHDNWIPLRKNPLIDVVIDEEIWGNWTLSTIVNWIDANEAICLEPTSLEIFRGHRWCITFEVTVKWSSTHMWSKEKWINAIEYAYEIIKLLKELEKKLLLEAKNNKDFDCWDTPLQLNVGVIKWWEWSWSVPEYCTIICDLGFLPDYSLKNIQSLIEKTCKSVGNDFVSNNLVITYNGLKNDAYIQDANIHLVNELKQSINKFWIKQEKTYWWKVSCDSRYYAKVKNISVITFWSGDLSNAHSSNEYVDLDELIKWSCILADYLST